MRNTLIRYALLFFFLPSLLFSCVDTTKDRKKNEVVVHLRAEPESLHPTNGLTDQRFMLLNLTQRFLVRNNMETYTLQPDLIEALPSISENGLEFTYKLRPEPVWDNGDPLRIEDVIFTVKAGKCPLVENSSAKTYLEKIANIQAVEGDERAFVITMTAPYLQNISLFTDYPIMQRSFHDPEGVLANLSFAELNDPTYWENPPEAVKAWAKEFNRSRHGREPEFLNGLGAYMVESWEPDISLTMVRKENHWTTKLTDPSIWDTSYPDKIRFVFNADKNSTNLEFKAGNYDCTNSLSTQGLADLRENEEFNANYYSDFVPNFNYLYLGMNIRPDGIKHQPFFSDIKVREALTLISSPDEVVSQYYKGRAKRVYGPVSPAKYDYNTNLKPRPLDEERARELLREAGWEDTNDNGILDKEINGKRVEFSFRLSHFDVGNWGKMAEIATSRYRDLGIEVIYEPLDVNVLWENGKKHDYDMVLSTWSSGSSSDDFAQIWHTKSWAQNGDNWGGFGDARSDSIIDTYARLIDPEERKPLSQEFQQLVYDSYAYIFLVSSFNKIAVSKKFEEPHMSSIRPGFLVNNLKLKEE